jgi:nucleotide-binding universal stress UspA family protein
MSPHYVKQQRPITDVLRRSVAEDLPELAEIKQRFAAQDRRGRWGGRGYHCGARRARRRIAQGKRLIQIKAAPIGRQHLGRPRENAMFKYILVPVTGSEADMPVFRTAAALARLHSAHLVFLHVQLDVDRLVVPIASAEFGGGSGITELIESLQRETMARHDLAKSAVHSFCAGEHITLSYKPIDGAPTAEWRAVTGTEVEQLPVAARAADLVVMGRVRSDKLASVDVLNAVLMDSGRPLLIVPAQPPDRIGDVLAIAWKDTAEAAGAVTARLPLLEGARQVVILSVTEDEQADRAACQRLREALEWHNPATTVQHLARSNEEPARTLLKAAANLGVDLLVMGAYGHSRTRSLVFGGMTGQVLRAADLPVLLAH